MKKLIIAFALLLMVAGLTVAVLKWLELGPFENLDKPEEASKAQEDPSLFVDMEALVIPIFDDDRVVATIQIELKLEVVGKDNLELVQRGLPRLRDMFVRDLHEFVPRLIRYERRLDIYTLKKRLELMATRVLPSGTVKNILIQSVIDTPGR